MFGPRLARLTLAAALSIAAPVAGAQQSAPATPSPEVGAVAPDFSVPGATRYGRLAAPVHLADFRGKTVVLAFFYRARTKG